jgi:glycosyltransferase involved in cell wall biosynthesis
MKIMAKTAVVMPIYNAGKTLSDVFGRIPAGTLPQIDEFILINDGSSDNSREIIKDLRQRFNNIVAISHHQNLGYGAAQKTGFKQALLDNADIVVVLHADGQYPPEMIADIVRPIKEGVADVVGGSRFLGGDVLKQGMPLARFVGKILLNMTENLIFRQKLTIYHEGYRAYSRKALERINFSGYSNYFSFDSEMLIGAFTGKLSIREIAIPTCYGEEKSYLNPVRYVWEILMVIIKYTFGRYKNR